MSYAREVEDKLHESMFYPCSEDDGTPMKRCGTQFPLYVYCDYSFDRQRIINRLRGYDLVEEAELQAVDLFRKSFEELEREYHDRLIKLQLRYENPYILFSRFRHIDSGDCIMAVNIRFEAIAVYNELYVNRGIVPKGFAHLRCGIGFGGNYGTYVREMNELLRSHGMPEYLLCDELCTQGSGDYLDILDNYKLLDKWRYHRPAYRQSGVDFLYKRRDLFQNFTLEYLLQESNKPGQDDGQRFKDPTRRNSIVNILSNNPKIDLLHRDDYLLLYTTGIDSTGDVTLISCHIDHVFDVSDLFINISDGRVSGTLDNSAGIGALLYSLQEYDYGRNVVISFTGGEENGFIGAEKTRDFLEEEIEDVYDRLGLVLTVDVTEENTDKDISIENLNVEKSCFERTMIRFNSRTALKKLVTTVLQGISFGVVEWGEPDEGHFYAEYDLNTISVCLPCVCDDGEGLHSRRGCSTEKKKIEALAQALYRLTTMICPRSGT